MRELLTDLRELAHGIHPPVLTDGGLVAAVEARAGRLPVPRRRPRRGDPAPAAVSPRTSRARRTSWSARPSPTSLKHADASATEIELAATGEVLSIDVSDDGAGFGVPGRGTGLTNSRDRVEALGGRLASTAGRARAPGCTPSCPSPARAPAHA